MMNLIMKNHCADAASIKYNVTYFYLIATTTPEKYFIKSNLNLNENCFA